MNMDTFSEIAYSAATRYLNYLKLISGGRETIYVNKIENIGKKKFKLFVSKKIYNQDSIMMEITAPNTPIKLAPEELNIVEYNEKELFIVIVTSKRLYDVLLTCRAKDILLFSDLTFLTKAVRKFYHDFKECISYPRKPNLFTDNIPRPEKASDEQYNAICSVLTSPVSYVWGAPGTGKTQMVLANCMIQYVNSSRSVLLIAPTNNSLEQSLRGVIKSMDEYGIPRKNIIRLGRANSEFLSSYPEVCESSQYEIAVDLKAKEIEQLRAEHERQLRGKLIRDSQESVCTLYSEHCSLNESLVVENSRLQELNEQLATALSKITEHRNDTTSLSVLVHKLKEQAEKQKRYFLFFKHFTEYRRIIDLYNATIDKYMKELMALQETHNKESLHTATLQANLSTKESQRDLYLQTNGTIIKRLKRFFSKSINLEYAHTLYVIQSDIDLISAELESTRQLMAQIESNISDLKSRIEQENSIKTGHPSLFEISTILYAKVLSFDDLATALMDESNQFQGFLPDDELDDKIASAEQRYNTAVTLFDSERSHAFNLNEQIFSCNRRKENLEKDIADIEQKSETISFSVFGSVFPISVLALKIDEAVQSDPDFALDDNLPALIEKKEAEYQSFVLKLKDILGQKHIIACTLDYATIHFDTLSEGISHSISHLFVDEAAYCPLIKAGVLFSFGVPVALFGDHMQLPPICEMDRKAITSTAENKPVFLFDLSAIYFADLFDNDVSIESIYQTYVFNKPPLFSLVSVTFLTKTFRFGQELASVLDTYIYHQGFHGDDTSKTEVIVIDAPRGVSNSDVRCSLAEAKAICKYLETAKPSNYIILAPYKAQCRTIERELKFPVGSVLTIHASQGREWDTVILSVTDALNPFFMSSKIAKSNGLHIINTAVSRTRQKLVLVLDYECWKDKRGELISEIANSFTAKL